MTCISITKPQRSCVGGKRSGFSFELHWVYTFMQEPSLRKACHIQLTSSLPSSYRSHLTFSSVVLIRICGQKTVLSLLAVTLSATYVSIILQKAGLPCKASLWELLLKKCIVLWSTDFKHNSKYSRVIPCMTLILDRHVAFTLETLNSSWS